MLRSFLKLKLIFSFCLLVGFVTVSYAQEDATMARPNTKSGSAAWMFTISGLAPFGMDGFDLAAFDLTGDTENPLNETVFGAGGKWFFSDDMALRALFGFSTDNRGDADPTKDPSGKTTTTLYGIAVAVELHTHPVYSTSPYIGGQISFAGASVDNQKTVSGTTVEVKGSGSAFSIGVLAGFDWYFTHGIAVGGEYLLGFTSTSISNTSGGTTKSLPSSSTIGISSGSVHLVVHM